MDLERVTRRVATALPRRARSMVFSHGAGAGVVGGLRESYTGNARAMYEWCLGEGLDATWLHASHVLDDAPGPTCNFKTAGGALAAMRAAVSMGGSNNGAPWPLLSERTWVVQGWHGTPLKAIGRAFGGSDPRDLAILERGDYFVSPGAEYTRRFRLCYDVAPERFWEVGNPRNDALVGATEDRRAALVGQLAAALPELSFRRVVLYAPTWREWRAEPSILELPDRDLHRLDAAMGDLEALLVIRPHHREAKAAMRLADQHQQIVVGDALDLSWDITSWLIASDLLITDYSSVFFDFLNLDRPVVHLVTDLEDYARHRGFLVDPREDYAGPVVGTQADLVRALAHELTHPGSHHELRVHQNAVHNPQEDGRSSDRVGRLIEALLDRPRSRRLPG